MRVVRRARFCRCSLSLLAPAALRSSEASACADVVVVLSSGKVLASVYEDTLAACAKMPATAAYRSNVEAITKDRLAVVQSVRSPPTPPFALQTVTARGSGLFSWRCRPRSSAGSWQALSALARPLSVSLGARVVIRRRRTWT